MTDVWRKMQETDRYQSVSDAEYLDMNIYVTLTYNLIENTERLTCRYTISGDTIQWRYFDSVEEIWGWLDQKIAEELETNRKALKDADTAK